VFVMRASLLACFAAFSLLAAYRIGLCADVGPISIAVPPGFDGPTSGSVASADTTAWVKRHPNADVGTLLQVTTYDAGAGLAGITNAQRAEGAEKYLLDFIGGVQRKRENFKLGAVQKISLASVPAARVSWTGEAGGMPTNGVMYCVIVGTTIVSFHTQDTGSEVTAAMQIAMKAIEGVQKR
jgi:hypothetical protein